MININELFEPPPFYKHINILHNTSFPWESLNRIPDYITQWIEREKNQSVAKTEDWGEIQMTDSFSDKILYIKKIVRLKQKIVLNELNISIGAGTLLEPSALIKTNVIIGENCEIRQGAYIRGNVIVGDNVVIGHNTEIKNSIVMNHSEAGHFSYIGDSIIGNYVNLGAGTKLANLQFRTISEKKSGNIAPIKVVLKKGFMNTETPKIGAVIGDGGELGCNSVTAPCVVLGKNCRVYPAIMVSKGEYPAGSVVK